MNELTLFVYEDEKETFFLTGLGPYEFRNVYVMDSNYALICQAVMDEFGYFNIAGLDLYALFRKNTALFVQVENERPQPFKLNIDNGPITPQHEGFFTVL